MQCGRRTARHSCCAMTAEHTSVGPQNNGNLDMPPPSAPPSLPATPDNAAGTPQRSPQADEVFRSYLSVNPKVTLTTGQGQGHERERGRSHSVTLDHKDRYRSQSRESYPTRRPISRDRLHQERHFSYGRAGTLRGGVRFQAPKHRP